MNSWRVNEMECVKMCRSVVFNDWKILCSLRGKKKKEEEEILDLCQVVSSTPCQLSFKIYRGERRAQEKIVDKLSKLMSNAFQNSLEFFPSALITSSHSNKFARKKEIKRKSWRSEVNCNFFFHPPSRSFELFLVIKRVSNYLASLWQRRVGGILNKFVVVIFFLQFHRIKFNLDDIYLCATFKMKREIRKAWKACQEKFIDRHELSKCSSTSFNISASPSFLTYKRLFPFEEIRQEILEQNYFDILRKFLSSSSDGGMSSIFIFIG